MQEELIKKIQDHLNEPEVKKNFEEILNKYLGNDKQKKDKFLLVFDRMINGDFDKELMDVYLMEEIGMEEEKAFEFNDELFEKVYISIYFDIEKLFESKQKETQKKGLPNKQDFQGKVAQIQEQEAGNEEQKIEKDESVTEDGEEKLIKDYNVFLNSSVMQNIFEAESQVEKMYDLTNDLMEIKNDFYASINAGDKIKVVAMLRVLTKNKKLEDFFENDKRYIDFYSGYLERHLGKKEAEEFVKEPEAEKYVIGFLRFLLEKRVGFSADESAMIGVGLGSIAREVGEEKYIDFAYGDNEKKKFVWNY
jgi:hypothetical protein